MAQRLRESKIVKYFHKAKEALRKLKPDTLRRTIGKRKQDQFNKELIDAARKGDNASIERLLRNGADIGAKDIFDQTALMWAANYGHTETCALLIKNGAKIEAKDDEGKIALMHAARYGHTQTCAFLIEKGADIGAKDSDGWTAFMFAKWKGKTETAEFLRLYHIRKLLGKGTDSFLPVFNECIQ